MKAPLSWLRDFVDIEVGADALAERLSLTGLTVDGVIRPCEGVRGVVVAEVLAKRDHPDADKLMLVMVHDGVGERPIVCGARNFEVGDKVPLAKPGAVLPGGFEIGTRKVRGELSEGMLCSAKELGLGADHSGILIADPGAEPGRDLIEALDLDDAILDIDVLPNRPDALSILGIAREIAALYGLDLRCPELPAYASAPGPAVTVAVEDPTACPRYTARTIIDVSGGQGSPWWLRRRLALAGMRPIDPIVDATNHTMLELGQPLHAFDLGTIDGAQIRVRTAHAGESIITLDGQSRALEPGDLLICDASRPVALAGVMGGSDTEVSEVTSTILLESASFAPMSIARTARRLDLRSEAAQRFERGVDPAIIEDASERCAALIARLTGGSVGEAMVADGPGTAMPTPIEVSSRAINARLGTDLQIEPIVALLGSVGCAVRAQGDDLEVTPPTWRPDITIAEDLSEEVARLYGYDRIEGSLPPGARVGGLTDAQTRGRLVRSVMLARGCNEAVTLSLLPPDFADRLSLPEGHSWRTTTSLTNALSAEESLLRPSLVPGLLDAARRNSSRRVLPVRVFETGTTFHRDGAVLNEHRRIAALLHGPARSGLHGSARDLDIIDARDLVHAIAERLGVSLSLTPTDLGSPLHPGRAALVKRDGNVIGWLAELLPRVGEALELVGRVAVFELDLDELVAEAPRPMAPVLPRHPSLDRDLAVVIPEGTRAAEVLEVIRSAGGPLLESVGAFDRYSGSQIGEGKVSLAFALRLRADDRTLTDDEAATVLNAVTSAIAERGWAIRA